MSYITNLQGQFSQKKQPKKKKKRKEKKPLLSQVQGHNKNKQFCTIVLSFPLHHFHVAASGWIDWEIKCKYIAGSRI